MNINRPFHKFVRMNESLVAVIHPSWWRYRWSVVMLTLLVVADFFFLTKFQTIPRWGTITFVVVLAFVVLWGVRIIILHHLNAVVLTSRRFIDIHQRRLFDREVAECPLEKIHHVRYHKKGIIATLADIGTVMVDTGSERGEFALLDMQNPDDIKELFMRTQKQYTKQTTPYQDEMDEGDGYVEDEEEHV